MADKKVRFINLNNQILTLGGDGILSFPDIATMASEPIANLQNGAIGWVDSEQKYFQWLDTNEISEMGRWKELVFGTDFQIFEYVDPNSEKYVGRIIQYCGETDTSTGFIKGCFYESRLTDKIDYVVVTLSEDAVGTYYTKDDDGNYSPITFNGTGENFDPNEIYYTKQEISLYNWVYINSLKVENVLDLNSQNAISNGAVTAKFDELREYVDNDLTTSLQQYTDDKIDDSEEEVFEDKTWSSSKTKDYIDTNLDDYRKNEIQLTQSEYDVLTDEEKENGLEYRTTDTNRIYQNGMLYGEKKAITLSSQAEYDQMKADGKIESDVDYVIEETEQNVNAVIGYVPIGVVFPYCATTPPVNYLICDGSLYEKTAYPELYAIIGNTFGGDDTTFAVPNLTDRFIQGGTNVGEYVEAGLPNITGNITYLKSVSNNDLTKEWDGAFKWTTYSTGSNLPTTTTSPNTYDLEFDASKSNAIYGNSDTVQPPSVVLLYIIKCK